MPTVIGIIFFCAAVYCFFLKQESLLGLLIVASFFGAASAINFGDRGIQPYYVVALFLIARGFLNLVAAPGPKRSIPQGLWLLIFGAIAIASAFVLPVMFAGIPVYDPKIGIDDGLFIR